MAAALPLAQPAARAPLSALAKVTIATLVACLVLMTYMQMLVGGWDPPVLLIFGIPAVLFALPVALIRRRWAAWFGVFFWAAFLAANGPYLAHDLAHPEIRQVFIFMVVLVAVNVIGLAAGLGAALARASGLPRWFTNGVKVVLGVCVGASFVAALPRAGSGVDAATLARLPALTTTRMQFTQPELRAVAGETVALRLENSDPAGHSFDIDELNVHVSMPPGEPTLALFTPTEPGAYVFYCSVPGHREAGMVGTLVVEP
jgi:uncharacterized cupredoxin-like copper-binding protein